VIGTLNRATSLALLLAVPLLADAAALMHVKWEGLTVVTGNTVSIAIPGGAVITGKQLASNPTRWWWLSRRPRTARLIQKARCACPARRYTGSRCRPKARWAESWEHPWAFSWEAREGWAPGWASRAAFGAIKNQGAAAAALIGITAAGTVGGYFLGNSIDKQWTVIEILP